MDSPQSFEKVFLGFVSLREYSCIMSCMYHSDTRFVVHGEATFLNPNVQSGFVAFWKSVSSPIYDLKRRGRRGERTKLNWGSAVGQLVYFTENSGQATRGQLGRSGGLEQPAAPRPPPRPPPPPGQPWRRAAWMILGMASPSSPSLALC